VDDAAYRQFVELEQSHFWFIGRRRIFAHLLDRELRGRPFAKVLDVGCGAGGMFELLGRYGEVTGIDTSPELVELSRSRGLARVEVGSAYELPVQSASVALITLFDTLEHIPDDERALRECRRALEPAGLLFVSAPAYQFLYANNDRVAHHERRYTARELHRKLIGAGFAPDRITYFNTLMFPAILPVVMAKKLRERLSDPGDQTNLSHTLRPGLNRALASVMSSERHLLTRVSLPFGHSLIAIARPRGSSTA
jgi:SAM-dependent methyltransferase